MWVYIYIYKSVCLQKNKIKFYCKISSLPHRFGQLVLKDSSVFTSCVTEFELGGQYVFPHISSSRSVQIHFLKPTSKYVSGSLFVGRNFNTTNCETENKKYKYITFYKCLDYLCF